ncbi:MAG TPA: response regulator transcription factor [Acidimicrobiales bacterium]|nr:response regulator transcription factor [Acidimicrobiales bacterium]
MAADEGTGPTRPGGGDGATPLGAPPAAVRVLVIDDHLMLAESVARILGAEDDMEVVGVAANSADGVRLAAEFSPDVVVADYQLPDATGAATAASIRAIHPETRVLILTGHDDDRLLADALEAGCSGFLTKDKAVEELVAAVHHVHAGEVYIPPNMLAGLLPRLNRKNRGLGSDLTPREMEVLRLLGEGASNQAIADRLYLSLHTVRHHVQSVLTKLNAHSKLEAVVIATREGLIERSS